MKTLVLAATAAFATLLSSVAYGQNDVTFDPPTRSAFGQASGPIKQIYFIANVTCGGMDSGLLGGSQSMGAHFKFMQGASFDYVWSAQKRDGLLKGYRCCYTSAKATTQEARQQGLNALGSQEEAKPSDRGAQNPDWIVAADYTFTVERTDQGGSDRGWGVSRSGSESYVTVLLSATITCFPFGQLGEGITIRASVHRLLLLGKEVEINDDGRPFFHLFRRHGSDFDRSTEHSSHESHARSATTILDEMETELYDGISEQLISQLPH